jgi:AcrR family transcriptional regulator
MTNRGRPPLLSDEAILKKALQAFASGGFEAMSVRALNANLGLSHETVSQRFGTKSELFLAAVNYGFQLFINDFNDELTRNNPTSDLEQLRALLRAFMFSTSRHPTLGELLHHEAIDEEQRNVIIGKTGLADQLMNAAELLRRLKSDGVIREIQLRELWFMAQSAAAPIHFSNVSQMFDFFDGPLEPDEHINRVTDIIMRGLLT